MFVLENCKKAHCDPVRIPGFVLSDTFHSFLAILLEVEGPFGLCACGGRVFCLYWDTIVNLGMNTD